MYTVLLDKLFNLLLEFDTNVWDGRFVPFGYVSKTFDLPRIRTMVLSVLNFNKALTYEGVIPFKRFLILLTAKDLCFATLSQIYK